MQGIKKDGGLLVGNVNKALRRGSFPSHIHAEAELYLCLGGSATDRLDGVEKALLPGDVLVHTENGVHAQGDLADFRCCIFQFHLDRLFARAEELGVAAAPGFRLLFLERPSARLFVDAETVRLAEEIADAMTRESDPAVLDILFLSLATLLGTRCRRREEREAAPLRCAAVGEVVSYIESHFSEELTLDTLAARSHYSRRHMTRLFLRDVGMPPMEYLDAVRIDEACRLLVSSDLPISAVGERCGFPDNNLFSRHFRHRRGLSPREYRRRAAPSIPTLRGVDIRYGREE
ncbi:MAG: helix-turn-helix domain-containing protein [Clostridia bacterium]|nr:helix-turn-helix domain-containing protein [Clostridia bacterium]